MPWLNLTENEREILSHRLEAQDAIADALTDCEDCIFTYDEVWNAAEEMLATVASDAPLFVDDNLYGNLRLAILVDAITGSTYFANIDDAVAAGELTRQKASALKGSASRLSAYVSNIVGEAVSFPNI